MSKACFSGLSSDGVAERRVDAALGRAGVAARRVDLRDERDVGARVERLDGGAHTRAAGPDDEHVVLRVHDSDAIGTALACGLVTDASTVPYWRTPDVMPIMGSGCFASTVIRSAPRVYVLGTRVHEWQLGAALLLAPRSRAA